MYIPHIPPVETYTIVYAYGSTVRFNLDTAEQDAKAYVKQGIPVSGITGSPYDYDTLYNRLPDYPQL